MLDTEDRYLSLFQESREAIFVSDADGKIVDVNPAALDLFGFTREEAMGADVGDRFIDPADRDSFRQALITGGGSVPDLEARLRKRDGTAIYCSIAATRRREVDGTLGGVQGYIHDITARKQAEEALRESEVRFRALAQSANDAIISAGADGRIVFWNEAAQRIFGYEEAEILGHPLALLMPERYREKHERGLERYQATGEPHIIGQMLELEGLRQDGTEFPLELTVSSWNTGAGRFVSGIVRDITERKEAEKALRESEIVLRQREKMAQLGTLSAGVAHELNNPATAVKRGSEQLDAALQQLVETQSKLAEMAVTEHQRQVLVDLAERARELGERPPELGALARSDREGEVQAWLEVRNVSEAWVCAPTLVNLNYDAAELDALAKNFDPSQLPSVIKWLDATCTAHSLTNGISEGATRISDIVGALRSYTYLDQAPVLTVDVHQGLDNTLLILGNKLKPGITVRREYSDKLPTIQAYGSELNQVWTNIIANAADALGDSGEITIRTRAERQSVVIQIEDNGPGMPAEIQSRVYDAFFTTKPPGHGTGLGLNISYNTVVHQHQGDIELFSQPGKTRFQVRLPITSDGQTTGLP